MNTEVMFSHESIMWATPQDLFDKLNAAFSFETDVCAIKENAKCANYYTPEQNGLSQKWKGVCWMNPPYGEPEYPCKHNCKKKVCEKRGYHISEYVPGIIDWVRKAYEESLNGATVVCLVPARTCTHWWHDYCMKGEITFLRGRLKFGGAKHAAPFPSAIVVFRPRVNL
ncbi:DNA N-6-adenine-methyltransferase [Paenibacillus dendritiformis]|uniref:DNA N-6-adenine-methyltransferase n=1 Tax=Paenibacillus dendritiformis TaxID=130049 RepID=UPI00365C5DB5